MKKRTRTKAFLMAGGLGNQLFIYAAGTYYSIQNKEKVIFDVSNRINKKPPHNSDVRSLIPDLIFQNRPYRWILKVILKKLFRWDLSSTYTSPHIGYDSALEKSIVEKQIFGYFQTYKYLDHPQVKQLLKDSFDLVSTGARFRNCLSELRDSPTISVHVRRGDYVHLRNSFGVLGIEYYGSAVNFILENSATKYRRVLVFSDDITEAKHFFSQIRISLPVHFVEGEDSGPLETLVLMAQSDALIISNSSFSWWAAQIGNQSKFVVCPSKWFRNMRDPNNLIPPEWHQQESQWEI